VGSLAASLAAASLGNNKLLGSSKLLLGLLAAASSFLAFWQQRAPSWPFGSLWNSNSRGSTECPVLLDHGNCLQQTQTGQPNSTMVTILAGAHHVPSQSLPPQQNQADQFFSRQAYGLGMGCLATVFTPQAFITTSRQ
jgi:hypothetical protein